MEKLSTTDKTITAEEAQDLLLGPKLPNEEDIPCKTPFPRLRDFVAEKLKNASIPLEENQHASADQIAIWWNYIVEQDLDPEDEISAEDLKGAFEKVSA